MFNKTDAQNYFDKFTKILEVIDIWPIGMQSFLIDCKDFFLIEIAVNYKNKEENLPSFVKSLRECLPKFTYFYLKETYIHNYSNKKLIINFIIKS